MFSIVAPLVLIAWPVVAVVLYRRWPVKQAAIWLVMIPFLVLPSRIGFDLPGLPPLDRHTIPAVTLFGILLVTKRTSKFSLQAPSVFVGALLVVYLLSPVFTVLTNSDSIQVGARSIQGLTLFDSLSMIFVLFANVAFFIVGYNYFKTEEDHRYLLHCIAISVLIYALPTLFEVRMAPVLHSNIYGFFQHEFAQHIRGGGFRPIVFLPHGLWLAFFTSVGLCAVAVLFQIYRKEKIEDDSFIYRLGTLRVWLVVFVTIVLVFCRSLAAAVYGAFFLVVVFFCKHSTQVKIASVLCIIAITYPATRSLNIFPTDLVMKAAYAIDEVRAPSLGLRFSEEQALLEKAMQRPFFGWGGWGRYRHYDEITGGNVSVSDGYWVIVMGSTGFLQFLCFSLLLASPIISLAFFNKRKVGAATAGLTLMVSINMIELLPNSSMMPFTWLMAGALASFAFSRVEAPVEAPSPRLSPSGMPRRRTIL